MSTPQNALPSRARSKHSLTARVREHLKEAGFTDEGDHPVTVSSVGAGAVQVHADHGGTSDGRKAVAGVWDTLSTLPGAKAKVAYQQDQTRAAVYVVTPA